MLIRDAVETDLSAIVAIYNAAIPSRMATADLEPVSVESRLLWFSEHTPGSRPIWVMEVDQVIAGWLSFQTFSSRPAYHVTAEISIYVAPAYQRCGIGRQLITKAIHHSPRLGLKSLVSLIFAHNQPSLRLVESMGFQRWGFLPQVAELDGFERDLVILGRRITQ